MPIVDTPLDSIADFLPSARAALRSACNNKGRQSVLLSWPGGATYLPSRCFEPGPFDVIVGRVVGCPVYADRRQLGLFLDSKVVIAAARPAPDVLVPLSVRVEPLTDESALEAKFAAVADSLADELAARLPGGIERGDVRTQVCRALEDLRGSVSFDSLAEMAIRLAEHRLSCAALLPR
jgi:hypothetical protein